MGQGSTVLSSTHRSKLQLGGCTGRGGSYGEKKSQKISKRCFFTFQPGQCPGLLPRGSGRKISAETAGSNKIHEKQERVVLKKGWMGATNLSRHVGGQWNPGRTLSRSSWDNDGNGATTSHRLVSYVESGLESYVDRETFL